VLVGCVTRCVLGAVGLDVSGKSIPYIAGWGEDGALDVIREYLTPSMRSLAAEALSAADAITTGPVAG
jgi:hypothetical protein